MGAGAVTGEEAAVTHLAWGRGSRGHRCGFEQPHFFSASRQDHTVVLLSALICHGR